MLPVSDTRHYLYWCCGPGDLVLAVPLLEICTSKPHLNKLACQAEHKSQKCGSCNTGLRGTTVHSLTNECPHGRNITTATGQDVQQLIHDHATKGKAYVVHLPLWFLAGDTPHGLAQCDFAPFVELDNVARELVDRGIG